MWHSDAKIERISSLFERQMVLLIFSAQTCDNPHQDAQNNTNKYENTCYSTRRTGTYDTQIGTRRKATVMTTLIDTATYTDRTARIDAWLDRRLAETPDKTIWMQTSQARQRSGSARRYFVWGMVDGERQQLFTVSAYTFAEALDKANRRLEGMR